VKVTLPANESRYCNPFLGVNGWDFDSDAIREAAEELDIRLDIRIRFVREYGVRTVKGSVGTHRIRRDRRGVPFHSIYVDQFLDPVQASVTLGHELVHAKQAEEAARNSTNDIEWAWHAAYQGENARVGGSYLANRYEIEAFTIEPQFSHKLLTYH
jgi:hypothetical protein